MISQVDNGLSEILNLIAKYETEAKKCGNANSFKVYVKVISDLKVIKNKLKDK